MTYAMGTSEAATYAGVPADAIRDAITRGDLPAGRVGKRRLYPSLYPSQDKRKKAPTRGWGPYSFVRGVRGRSRGTT